MNRLTRLASIVAVLSCLGANSAQAGLTGVDGHGDSPRAPRGSGRETVARAAGLRRKRVAGLSNPGPLRRRHSRHLGSSRAT